MFTAVHHIISIVSSVSAKAFLAGNSCVFFVGGDWFGLNPQETV